MKSRWTGNMRRRGLDTGQCRRRKGKGNVRRRGLDTGQCRRRKGKGNVRRRGLDNGQCRRRKGKGNVRRRVLDSVAGGEGQETVSPDCVSLLFPTVTLSFSRL